VTGATSTQAVTGYTAPKLSARTVEVYDGSGYRFAALKVTAATNASPMAITTEAQHTLVSGDKVYVNEVGGNTNGNGFRAITVPGSSTFTLDACVGNGAYTSPGSVAVVVHDVKTRLFAGLDEPGLSRSACAGRGPGARLLSTRRLSVPRTAAPGPIPCGLGLPRLAALSAARPEAPPGSLPTHST
jgi:hypothetical protein